MEPLNFDGTAAASLYTRLYLRGAVHRQRHPNAVVRNVSFAVEGFRMALKHLWQTLKRSCVGDHQDYSMGYVITAENRKVVSGFLLKISTRSSIITRLYNSGALDVGVYQCGFNSQIGIWQCVCRYAILHSDAFAKAATEGSDETPVKLGNADVVCSK